MLDASTLVMLIDVLWENVKGKKIQDWLIINVGGRTW